ncbi:MAG: glycosyltransferase family 9 protein [Anaerolineae bacterium]|nr:glycosyltransferase family 9 protein [Anaerolineae bacterium]
MIIGKAASGKPRVVLILPCCIGDVVLATPALKALRRAYPNAHIAWAVGSWSKPAIEHHDLLDSVIDTGADALPVRSPGGVLRFVRQLRAGKFDLAVSLVRSPLMSAAVLLSGIPQRAGIDSAGRGFGYTVRAKVDPNMPRHEAEIYLDVIRALDIDTAGCYANVPVFETDAAAVREKLRERGIDGAYLVINPAGGRNPGMVMDAKRYPPEQLAALANRLAAALRASVVLVGGYGDAALVEAVQGWLDVKAAAFIGELRFGEIAALARAARLYLGNDTGLTHLAAASGAKTVMILGPSDPARYAPFAPDALALWKPTTVARGGVAAGAPDGWDWARDGIGVDAAEQQIRAWLDES